MIEQRRKKISNYFVLTWLIFAGPVTYMLSVGTYTAQDYVLLWLLSSIIYSPYSYVMIFIVDCSYDYCNHLLIIVTTLTLTSTLIVI